MLKKLLLASMLGLSFTASHAMQSPTSPIRYEGPQPTIDNKEIEINAKDEDNFAIGWIMYKYLADQKAEITLFEVDEDFQNNKKQHRVGQNLFERFVTDVIAHNCTQIYWTVNPVGNLDTRTLCTIYKKIINKLPHSSGYTVSEGDAYGPGFKKIDMMLSLKKMERP
jgi:hypothetical protein